jgi:hypothetical protein
MEAQFAEVAELKRSLIDEIFNAVGLPPWVWLRWGLSPLVWRPAGRFAQLTGDLDHWVAEFGVNEAARRFLALFVQEVAVRGETHIPPKGPLLIASNHPGALDSLAITANLPRQDLKIVVSGSPFFHKLTFASRHLIYAPEDPHQRMLALRSAIRHLSQGGVLLIFPSGIVDPDPAVFPSAAQSVEAWSSSLALMLEKVPGTRLLIARVSNVLARECWRHPLVRLRRGTWEKQKLAEFIQIIQQLVLARRFPLTPCVTFTEPVTLPEICLEERTTEPMQAILRRARRVMA